MTLSERTQNVNTRFFTQCGGTVWTLLVVIGCYENNAFAQQPAQETVFFAFDDQNLAWQHNLKLTLEHPQKHPENPVLRRGPKGAPDYGHAILYGTVLHLDGKFRMWYLAMIQREIVHGQAPGWWRPMCYAESDDGVHWTKPELGLVDLGGNTKNNICRIDADVPSMTLVNDFLSVLHDPTDPDPERRFKCAYIAHMPYDDIRGGMSRVGIKEGRVGALVTATSRDGLHWKCVGDRPANAGGERFEVSGLYRFGNFYYASGQCASPWGWLADGRDVGRMMYTYRSPDFKTWSAAKSLSMVLPEQQTQPQPEFNKMLAGYGKQMHMGVSVWNRGNVLVGMPGLWLGLPANQPPTKKPLEGLKIDLGLALSTDGVHFHEPVPNFPFIEHGAADQWDSIALLQGHAFVNHGDKTYLWYSHWDCESDELHNMDIGLATMRRDGFGYLSRKNPGDPGHCVSSPVTIGPRGAQVVLNASGLTNEAPAVVELLDELDHPLPDFAGPKAASVRTDGVHTTVTWPGQDSLPPHLKVTIRVTLPDNDQARLYAIYVENRP